METRITHLNGIFPALLTPFDEDGNIKFDALEKLVDGLVNDGVDGFYVCGSSGEAFMMTSEERMKVFEAVSEANAGRTTLICHSGAISTKVTCDLAAHAAKHGADVISAVPPFYYKFTTAEVKQFYSDVADAAGVPMLIYNYPGATGFSFTLDDFIGFSKDSRFVGIKHTTSDYYMMERVKSIAPDFTVMNGFDEMLLSGLAMSADGAIGTTFNLDPKRFIKLYQQFKSGDLCGARKTQSEANEMISYMLAHEFMPCIKEFCRITGRDAGICRKPFARPAAETIDGLKKLADKFALGK